jgi:hypothetical protein
LYAAKRVRIEGDYLAPNPALSDQQPGIGHMKAASVLQIGDKRGALGWQRHLWQIVFGAGEGEDASAYTPLPSLIQNKALKIRR